MTPSGMGTERLVCISCLDRPFVSQKIMMNSVDFVMGMEKQKSYFGLRAFMIVTLLGLGVEKVTMGLLRQFFVSICIIISNLE